MEKQRNSNIILKLREKIGVGRISLLDFKIYYIALVMYTVYYWWRNGHKNQWNRTENAKIDPHKYAQLIFLTNVQKQINAGTLKKEDSVSTNSQTIGHPQSK
jgi:hypothetical protein